MAWFVTAVHNHAVFIAERFDANYPHLAGHFARVVDYQTSYAQSLIDSFSQADQNPHIAISVDMLDTGIDVPEVVNLLFFKIVRSRTKFWQMIGRGTRLCPDLFGPKQHKDQFLIFDFCQNFEFFSENPDLAEPKVGRSLGERLFAGRVMLAGLIDDLPEADNAPDLTKLGSETKAQLFEEVSGMNLDNFIVRPKRRSVEKFQVKEAWVSLSGEDRDLLVHDVAGLPTAVVDNDTVAKQFDYIVLSGQLDLLQGDPVIATCKQKVQALAARLEELDNIPMVKAEMPLILEVQTDEYWQDIGAWPLEQMRRRLRALIKLIEGEARQIVYTDFEDEIGAGVQIVLPDVAFGTDKARFQLKMRHFLKAHEDHITIQKLHRNEQLTPQDLAELERIMVEEAVASDTDLEAIRTDGGLGLFIRSLVGLDREAAKAVFAGFLAGRTLGGNQIHFVNLIIEHLTERGAMDPRRLYESPFTDLDDQGVSGLFPQADIHTIVQVLTTVRERAAA